MTIFITIMGWLATGAILLSIMAGMFTLAATALRKLLERHDRAIKHEALHHAGFSVGSWWFSEHEPTRWLLEQVSRNMRDGHQPLNTISETREEWRKRLQAYQVVRREQ